MTFPSPTFAAILMQGNNAIAFGGNRTWSPLGSPTFGLTQPLLNSNASVIGWTGSSQQTNGYIGLGVHYNLATSIDASANTGGMAGGFITVSYNTGAQGGMSGFINSVVIPNTPSDTISRELTGGRDFIVANAASGAAAHTIEGRTIAATLGVGASGYAGLVGLEVATQAVTGTAPPQYVSLYTMRYAGDAVQGTVQDMMYGAWNQFAQSGSKGTKAGIGIGPQGATNLFFPVGTNGDIIQATAGATDGALTVANGINFAAIGTFTAAVIDTVPFKVDGSGNVTAASFGYKGAGNHQAQINGGGQGGANFASTDGTLLQIVNNAGGTPTTTWASLQAGTGTAFITATGSATNKSLSINSSGAGSGIGFQAGNTVFIDINGNTNVASLIVGAGASPTITSGAGAPGSTQPNGSLYLRTNGGASTRLYVSEGGGTWAPITSA